MSPYDRLYRQLSAAETLSVTHPEEWRLNARGERVLSYLRRRLRRSPTN